MPRQHLTIYQQYLAIARLQVGCSQREVATELSSCTSHADDRFIVNSALWNRIMNATQLQARLRDVRDTRVSRQTIRNRLNQHGLRARWPARVPDHTTRHRRHRQGAFALDEEPVDLGAVLRWKSIHIEQKWWPPALLETSRRILCISHCCLVLQSEQVCLVNTELPYTLWTVLWQANTTWITSLI